MIKETNNAVVNVISTQLLESEEHTAFWLCQYHFSYFWRASKNILDSTKSIDIRLYEKTKICLDRMIKLVVKMDRYFKFILLYSYMRVNSQMLSSKLFYAFSKHFLVVISHVISFLIYMHCIFILIIFGSTFTIFLCLLLLYSCLTYFTHSFPSLFLLVGSCL